MKNSVLREALKAIARLSIALKEQWHAEVLHLTGARDEKAEASSIERKDYHGCTRCVAQQDMHNASMACINAGSKGTTHFHTNMTRDNMCISDN